MMTHGTVNGRTIGRMLMGLAVVGLFVAVAAPASAHDEWRHDGDHYGDNDRHDGRFHRDWHGPRVEYYPPPQVVYAQPRVVYLPRPMPVYQPPSISFVFPLR